MKKFRMLLLCIGLLVVAAGCGGKKEDTAWIDESAAKISNELTDGQFVLDGVVYTFPMSLQYWLDNGWHISNNYDNKNTFKLDAWYTSDEFELFNEAGDWVRVAAYNNSDEAAKLDQCMVCSVYMSLSEVDVVFPTGVTKRNNPADILAAYGEPDVEDGDDEYRKLGYFYNHNDEWQCMARLDVLDNDYTENPLSSVKYQVMFFDDFWNAWVDEGGIEKAVKYYVDADIKASFLGDYEDCINYAIATKEQAQEWHDTEKLYYAEALMWYTNVDSTYMDEATLNRFCDVAGKVLAKSTWEYKSVEPANFGGGKAVIIAHPTNFFDIIVDDVNNAITAWETKYANTDLDAMSDAEYAALEIEYADMVLKAIDAKVAQVAPGESVELECTLDTDGSILADESWLNLYDALMGLYYEE